MDKPIDKSILQYLANKIIQDISTGNIPEKELCIAITGFPYIDYIRIEMKPSFMDIAFDLCKSEQVFKKALGFALLQPLVHLDEVKSFIRNQWNEANNYDLKRQLLWRLLDIPDLPVSIHKNIYEFIKENWDKFIADSNKWNKVPMIKYVEDRLHSESHAESKKWIYLCLATSIEDKTVLKSQLDKYKNSNNSIIADVVRDLLNDFF